MNKAEKTVLIEEILMRAADQMGDVTPAAMEVYYRRHPEVKAVFESHDHGGRDQLEGMMIENALHCLMRWFEAPAEIEILLNGSVTHHSDTLHVSPDWYGDLIEATAEVIAATIPANNAAELAVWNELRKGLQGVIDNCRQLLVRQNKQ